MHFKIDVCHCAYLSKDTTVFHISGETKQRIVRFTFMQKSFYNFARQKCYLAKVVGATCSCSYNYCEIMEPFITSFPTKRRRRSKSQDRVKQSIDDHRTNFHADDPSDVNVNEIRSSWLIGTGWWSSRICFPVEPSECHESFEQNEIKQMCQQLVMVKRRLGPAAERCAEKFGADQYPTAVTDRRSRLRYIFGQARRACNPYEVLGEGRNGGLNQYLFMNRSAIKLANMDALVGFCLTKMNSYAMTDRCTFKFCDLCGAPGGFSEYILWRLRHPVSQSNISSCRGYAMSLVGANEHGCAIPWKLRDKTTQEHVFQKDGVGKMCQQYKICHGVDGTGDIYNWENVVSLQLLIQNDDTASSHSDVSSAKHGKVHLVLADGGFDAQRDVENQEEVAQKLVGCEAAAALSLLCTGGTMVIKLFGFQTAVVRSMMRHFYFSFEHVIALKPISSRPASTERYVVCVGFHGNPGGWTGRRWLSDMYLARPCALSTYNYDINFGKNEAALYSYLNKFDRDVCLLNLTSNFAILSLMERNCSSLRQGDSSDSEDDLEYHVSRINIPLYRIAWRLDC
jgi:cap1 methyltransferase